MAEATTPISEDRYLAAKSLVLGRRKASAFLIQRKLQMGYDEAAAYLDRMEREKLIGPLRASGAREILVPAEA